MGGFNWTRVAKKRSIERYGAEVTLDVEVLRSKQRAKKASPTPKKKASSLPKANATPDPGPFSARFLAQQQKAVRERERLGAARRAEQEVLRLREERLAKARAERASLPPPATKTYRPVGDREVEVRTKAGGVRVVKL